MEERRRHWFDHACFDFKTGSSGESFQFIVIRVCIVVENAAAVSRCR